MPTLRRAASPLVLGLTLVAARAAAQDEAPAVRDALLFRGQLIALRDDGHFTAWDAATARPCTSWALAPVPNQARRIATDGTELYAASTSALWSWSPVSQAWSKAADFDAKGENVQGLALVSGFPVVVLDSRVLLPTENGDFAVPKGTDLMSPAPPLRVLALHASVRQLWIGTGYGEWGGELIGFDIVKGTWVRHTETLSYVTGIAQSSPDELAVSWSMSHMGEADARLRIHGLDGSVKSEGVERRDAYLQALAWSPFDKSLFAVDTGMFVALNGDEVNRFHRLDGAIYGEERHAVGVAPGIVAVLPAGEKSVFIVPAVGVPWRWHHGELVCLEPAGPPVGAPKPPR